MSRAFRYNLILVLVALGTTLAAVAGWRFARASAPVSGPIVLVTVDALRADRLPAYGYTRGFTPALDALAADGVLFERAYSHSPLGLPAHASLLSGRLPPATGIRDDVSAPIPDTLRLVSAMLADRGYATGGIVSSKRLRKSTGLGQGFMFFDDDFGAGTGTSTGARPPSLLMPSIPLIPVMQRDGGESERHAERWLSAAGTSRAFLFLHLAEPHAPYAPPPHLGRLEPYDGEVAYADEILAALIAYLKKQQLYEESTIIVVGDHGEGLGGHGEQQHGGFVFEETARVPLIIKLAGGAGGGRRVGDVVQHVDLVPTILDLAKAPAPDDLPGRSLRPLLDGQTFPERMVYTESLYPAIHFGSAPLRSVTDGRYRYIGGPTPALFDLTDDAANQHDVAGSHPDEVARFDRALQEFSHDVDVPVPPRLADVPADERDRFLGLRPGPRAIAGDAGDDGVTGQADIALIEAYGAAMDAASERRWASAIDQLRALARAYPTRADLWGSLAVVAERGGRTDIAIEAYRHVLGLAPNLHEMRARLATVLLRAKRPDDARQQAELAARSGNEAEQVEAEAILAKIAVARRDVIAARLHAERAQEIDPTSAMRSFIEGRLQFDRGQFADALEWFDKAVAEAGEAAVAELHWWRGESLLKLDRQAEAEEAWLTELRIHPESPRVYVGLAAVYHAQGRIDDTERLIGLLAAWRTPEALESAARFWASIGDRTRADAIRSDSGS